MTAMPASSDAATLLLAVSVGKKIAHQTTLDGPLL